MKWLLDFSLTDDEIQRDDREILMIIQKGLESNQIDVSLYFRLWRYFGNCDHLSS